MKGERTVYKILIVDDERDIVNALKIYLADPEYELLEAFNGKEALETLEREEVQLVLLDIMMPVMDGLSAMAEIRRSSNVPIILLTAKGEDADKVLGLNIGADDYITKPFSPLEVAARVRSQLRRYTRLGGAEIKEDVLNIGGIELDNRAKTVSVDGENAAITPTEFEILRLLMENPGEVFAPKEIYRRVWKNDPYGSENTVAVHIRHLREKIEIDPTHPRYLKVIWGQGYKMERSGKP